MRAVAAGLILVLAACGAQAAAKPPAGGGANWCRIWMGLRMSDSDPARLDMENGMLAWVKDDLSHAKGNDAALLAAHPDLRPSLDRVCIANPTSDIKTAASLVTDDLRRFSR